MRECERPGVMKVKYDFLVVKLKGAETIYLNFNNSRMRNFCQESHSNLFYATLF